MPQHHAVIAVLRTARQLRRIQDLQARCTARLIHELEQVPDRASAESIDNLLGSTFTDPRVSFTTPIVDLTAMRVTWRGKSCPLGNTHLLAIMERIARNPNRWIPYERLKWDIWHDESVGDGAVKVTVVRLRRQLSLHGMERLSALIRVSGPRCGYFPGGTSE